MMKFNHLSTLCWSLSIVAAFAFAGMSSAHGAMIADSEITDAVESEILLDGAVLLNTIDITTTDGIVSLTGDVENILAKERAARIASIVKGTRSVVNRIEVNPVPPLEDDALRRDIENALLRDPATDSYEIDVAVKDGHVTLTGTVDSWQERNLVARVAKGQDGVRSITSNVDIDYNTNRSDTEIEAEIEKSLAWNALVDHGLIDVSVDDGDVTLSGIVGSAAEKQRALSNAWVAGTKSVDMDNLEVQRWARDDDLRESKYAHKDAGEIREALNDAFLYDPRVMSFEIDTDIDGSIATLRGTVDNLKAKRAAEQSARNTVGVTSVRNFIKVQPVGEIADETIEERIENALGRDPFVNRYDVTVSVLDGTAYLYGEVDSYFERGQVDELASRAAGVTTVRNHLSVADADDPYYTNPYISPWTWYDYDWRDYTPSHTLRDDLAIKNDIESQIYWSPFVDSDSITVTVDDGEAQLTGTVESWSERSAATENAFEGGATWVDNDLIVDMGAAS